jgi:ribosomal protein S12 methylthiotransferase
MNRRYSRQDLLNLISKIRRRIPGIALRTSVIVGFPGEGEAEFKELYDFVKEVKFERLGVFAYSKEEGTPAYKMRGQVSEKLKKQRFQKLMRLGACIARGRNNTLIGKTLESIIEGAKKGYYIGRTSMDAPEIDGQVFIKKSKSLKPGEIKNVRISSLT